MKIKILIFCLVFPFGAQANQSAYTSLEEKKCQVLESSENDPEAEIDYFSMACPGRDGYSIQVAGGDLRSWLVVLKNNQVVYDGMADINNHIGGHFAYIAGEVLEWRYDQANKLVSLIVRVNAQDENDSNKALSRLLVFRHNNGRFCFLGIQKTNEAAQRIADSRNDCPR